MDSVRRTFRATASAFRASGLPGARLWRESQELKRLMLSQSSGIREFFRRLRAERKRRKNAFTR